jgi:hypothetical protein
MTSVLSGILRNRQSQQPKTTCCGHPRPHTPPCLSDAKHCMHQTPLPLLSCCMFHAHSQPAHAPCHEAGAWDEAVAGQLIQTHSSKCAQPTKPAGSPKPSRKQPTRRHHRNPPKPTSHTGLQHRHSFQTLPPQQARMLTGLWQWA